VCVCERERVGLRTDGTRLVRVVGEKVNLLGWQNVFVLSSAAFLAFLAAGERRIRREAKAENWRHTHTDTERESIVQNEGQGSGEENVRALSYRTKGEANLRDVQEES